MFARDLGGDRPVERAALERRDVDCRARVPTLRVTKTAKSRREVPLSARAIAALDRPPRLGPPRVFSAPAGQSALARSLQEPGVDTGGRGGERCERCRIYNLRSTFASNALAAGVTVFELARLMGTSVEMVEHHYGALIDGAHAGIVGRLDAIKQRSKGRRALRPTSRSDTGAWR